VSVAVRLAVAIAETVGVEDGVVVGDGSMVEVPVGDEVIVNV
jgi:hypothetical protein